jgi:galactokinase
MLDQLRSLKKRHEEVFGPGDGLMAVRAPGRVNLIGEHTDYNDGYVLPIAIERDIIILARKREDRSIILHSMDFNDTVSFSLDSIHKDPEHPWADYPKGIAHVLEGYGLRLQGMEGVIKGNVPLGAGLSSSAAFEVATALAFQTLNNFPMDGIQMAKLCQRAENEFVGVNCGIMDQFISRLGRRDHALLIDCRSLNYSLIPLPFKDFKIAIVNTGVKRGLVDSEYNRRRAECEEGVKVLSKHLPDIKALRDVSLDEFLSHKDMLPPTTRLRCQHVIEENQRVLDSVDALKSGDVEAFGELLVSSHESLRNKYQVSCSELDIAVQIALNTEGVLGSRMTGAGFGGCTVSLVHQDALQDFVDRIMSEYPTRTNLNPQIYISSAHHGACKLNELP